MNPYIVRIDAVLERFLVSGRAAHPSEPPGCRVTRAPVSSTTPLVSDRSERLIVDCPGWHAKFGSQVNRFWPGFLQRIAVKASSG